MDLIPINVGLVAFVLLALSLGGLFKGMTGLGLPMFAVPALAVFMSVEEAVVLMIIPCVAANIWMVVSHRQFRPMLREHLPFLASGFIGGIAGTTLLLFLDDRTDRDVGRFLGDELPREDKTTFEFTYLYRRDRGLSILAGANVQWQSDTETDEFTSEREVYIKVVYDLRRDFPEGW